MAETVKMPKNGLTMREGTVAKIHVKKGEAVKKGQPLLEYETDKITGEMESPQDGTVLEIYVQEGDTVEVLAPLMAVGDPVEAVAAAAKIAEEKPVAQDAPVEIKPTAVIGGRILASPLARKLARDYGFALENITATGPDGRIVKKDVEQAMQTSKVRATPLAKKFAREKGIDLKRVPGSGPNGRIQRSDVETMERPQIQKPPVQAAAAVPAGARREKMSAMRRTIAQRLQQSKQTIPHVYFKCEVDATGITEVKNTISPVMQQKYGQKLSVNDIVLAAAAAVLKEFPVFSAQVDGDEIVHMDAVHLGFAVSLENGLIVPVIRHADRLTLAALSMEAAKLAGKAKAMQLSREEITGGTFTVSNLGGYGLEEFFAIINPPESGILAVGTAIEKAVAVNGQLAVRPMMTLCLSVDHRLIDGAVAAAFLKRLKETLEDVHQLIL